MKLYNYYLSTHLKKEENFNTFKRKLKRLLLCTKMNSYHTIKLYKIIMKTNHEHYLLCL